MVKTKNTVSTHKPLNLNCSLAEKSLMCGSFNLQPTKENIGKFANQKSLGEWS